MPTFEVSTAAPAKARADLLVVPVFEGRRPGPGAEDVAGALGADVASLLGDNQLQGRLGETLTVPTLGRLAARTVLLLGLGRPAEAGPSAVRRALQRLGARAGKYAVVATTLGQVEGPAEEVTHALAEGVLLATYRFDRYKRRPLDEGSRERPSLKRIVVLAGAADRAASKAGLRRGQVYAEAANWARDLVNTPAVDATPEFLAREATRMAEEVGIECRVWTKAQLRRKGFGGVLGVGSGSVNEPRLIELAYRGGGEARPIALTGKGITFDSGGLSLKTSEGMENMKDDMGGAAAVLAALRAVAQLKLPVNVVAAVPSAENMPGGSAIRPGDVLTHYGGKTSEVLNTDAEGRLILADALAFLAEQRPAAIIDAATLTGAAVVALGPDLWGVMGSHPDLVQGLLEAGREEGEPGWELPLWTDYRRLIESTVADVKNVGDRYGGAITAGLFLKEFVGDVPWAHLDVAGTAFAARPGREWPRGATGSPARTLIRYLERRAAGDGGAPAGDGSRARGRARSRAARA